MYWWYSVVCQIVIDARMTFVEITNNSDEYDAHQRGCQDDLDQALHVFPHLCDYQQENKRIHNQPAIGQVRAASRT